MVTAIFIFFSLVGVLSYIFERTKGGRKFANWAVKTITGVNLED